jgi:hypothetical protein
MNGLKLEPGWRHAWVTWLNLLRLKSKPPTSADRAVARIQRDERRLRPRAAGDRPGRPWRPADHPDDRAAADLDLGRRLVRQPRLGGAQAFAGDRRPLAVLQHGDDLLRDASSTTAAISSSLSGKSASASSMRVVELFRVAGRSM